MVVAPGDVTMSGGLKKILSVQVSEMEDWSFKKASIGDTVLQIDAALRQMKDIQVKHDRYGFFFFENKIFIFLVGSRE
jgi:hypothetical protein